MKIKQILIILLLLGIVLIALFPLFTKGFFVTDDGEWMIIRFSSFYQALADGQFPVRFLHRLNLDYGYPVATFLYPGFMYAGIPFHILKIGFVDTIKIILGISLAGTTLFTYFWLAHVFKKSIAAIAGAVISLYLPYHLYDVYTRGSVGELFALFWVSFILWMIERKNIFFMSIGIALLLTSHNSLAVLFLPLLFLYAILRKIFFFRELFISFVFGILLSAFFIIPAVFELSFTNFSQTHIADPLQYFATIQLIGLVTLIIFFFSLVLFFSKKKFAADSKLLISFFIVITFFSIFFSSSWSSLFWQFIPASFIQFPFRLLSLLVVSLPFLTAFCIGEIPDIKKKVIILVCLFGLVIFSSRAFLSPKIYFDKGEGYYFTNEATTTVQDEYMPVWVKIKPLQRAEKKVEITQGKGTIENIVYNNRQTTFSSRANENVRVKVHTVYWPGWNVFIDKKAVMFSYSNPTGVIEFTIPKGSHQVQLLFGETPLRLVSDSISFVSFILLIFYSIRNKRKL